MPEFKIDKLPGNLAGVQILKLTGPFTLQTVFDFQAIVREQPAAATIVDLTGVPYMDSAALGSILGLHISCQRDGRKYAITGVSDRIRTLFKITGVDNLLVIRPSVSEAEAGLASL